MHSLNAWPSDFIPLPRGAESRARFVMQIHELVVYHFDPYSTALSKIERGREEDLSDVLSLLRQGWLEWSDLAELSHEVAARMESEGLRADPDRFRRHFDAMRRRFRESRGGSVDSAERQDSE